jgi:hypothetical protein
VDEISHGREPRVGRPRFPWLSLFSSAWSSLPTELRVAWLAAGVLFGASVLVIVTLIAGHDGSLLPLPSAAAAAPDASAAPVTASALGTAVVGCDQDGWWHLGTSWQASSVRAGPLWLVGARATGYARVVSEPGPGAGTQAGPASASLADRSGAAEAVPVRTWLMVVHVVPGTTVVLRAAAGSAPYFQFIDGEPVGPYQPADGNQGLEFQACQRPGTGQAGTEQAGTEQAGTEQAGWVDIYNVGFAISPGRSASVEVLSPGSAPTWLTFTAPVSS